MSEGAVALYFYFVMIQKEIKSVCRPAASAFNLHHLPERCSMSSTASSNGTFQMCSELGMRGLMARSQNKVDGKVWHLQVGKDVGEGGRAPEGQHDHLPVPADQQLGVGGPVPHQLRVREGRLEERAPLLQAQLAVLHLQSRI